MSFVCVDIWCSMSNSVKAPHCLRLIYAVNLSTKCCEQASEVLNCSCLRVPRISQNAGAMRVVRARSSTPTPEHSAAATLPDQTIIFDIRQYNLR